MPNRHRASSGHLTLDFLTVWNYQPRPASLHVPPILLGADPCASRVRRRVRSRRHSLEGRPPRAVGRNGAPWSKAGQQVLRGVRGSAENHEPSGLVATDPGSVLTCAGDPPRCRVASSGGPCPLRQSKRPTPPTLRLAERWRAVRTRLAVVRPAAAVRNRLMFRHASEQDC